MPHEQPTSEVAEESAGSPGRSAILEHGPSPWGEVAVGLALFLGLGVVLVLFEHLAEGIWYLAGWYVAVCAGWGLGWVRRFPRWSYPYGGLILVMASWWVALGTNLTWIIVMDAALPLAVVVVVAVILAPTVDPWRYLFRGVWQDWTRVSFAIYAVVPLALWVQLDQIDLTYKLLLWAPTVLLVAAGALAYLRSSRAWLRVLSLSAGLILSWTSMAMGVAAYWDGRRAPWTFVPTQWSAEVRRLAAAGAILLGVLLSPVLLGVLRRVGEYVQQRRPQEPDSG